MQSLNITNLLPLLIILSAMLPGLLILCIDEKNKLRRRRINLGGNLLCVGLIGILIAGVYNGMVFETRLPLLPGLDLVLHADALSLLFVGLSGLLWLLTTIYAIGYLEGTKNRSRFFAFFSLCVSATLGIALAGNLMTFLIFYELLTLTTYPLIVHKGDKASLHAGRVYLTYTMIGGALLLAGVVWLKTLAGPLDFTATGILSQMPELEKDTLMMIFALLITGLGVKAALVPLHGWLPVAMAAPAPVSALLHAVAVVKAGAFGIIRVVYDVYGIEFTRDLGLTTALAGVAAITIVYGSIRAVFQDDLKKRLAYSTISQVSYIALGTAIAGPIATIGGMIHLVHQGLMKITLFFCAGNLAETLGIHKVSEMKGAGKRMPLTMTAFTIAALGMIGLPPIAGFVSKWYLGLGALEVGAYWVLAILLISSILNAIYFLPIIYSAWFEKSDGTWQKKPAFYKLETNWMLLLPPTITALLALIVGLFASFSFSPLSWAQLITAREYGQELLTTGVSSDLFFPGLSLIILTPLLIAAGFAVSSIKIKCQYLICYAALPALVLAALSPVVENSIPWLFFGSTLSIDENSRIILLLAALLWTIAGVYSLDYLRKDNNLSRYCVFFLVSMAGNFGLILAQDIFSFITFFTIMSMASYGLIIHSGSHSALAAGKSYIQWVIVGEVLLFAALVGIAVNESSQIVSDFSKDTQPLWVSSLLMLGFGIKAGLLTVHVWLPRAHPVAPIPASALLSGLMVKAGFLGWIRFLPLGETALPEIGFIMLVLGLGGAFIALIIGFLQENPKALLAYSTISQMGIITAGIGIGLTKPELWPLLLPALLLYVLHHGFIKSALFLSLGLTPLLKQKGHLSLFIWLIILLPILALVGLPLTSGALAKFALKEAVSYSAILPLLFSLTAIGTTCIMLRFVYLLRDMTKPGPQSTLLSIGGNSSYIILILLPIVLLPQIPLATPYLNDLYSKSSLWNSLWPIIAGSALYIVTNYIAMNMLYTLPTFTAMQLSNGHWQALKTTLKTNTVSAFFVKKLTFINNYKFEENKLNQIAILRTRIEPGPIALSLLLIIVATLAF